MLLATEYSEEDYEEEEGPPGEEEVEEGVNPIVFVPNHASLTIFLSLVNMKANRKKKLLSLYLGQFSCQSTCIYFR